MGYIYILTNQHNTVLYIGVTNDLTRRAMEHKCKINKGFSYKYNLNKLVYYECFEHFNDAIAREKFLKGKRRQVKIDLIQAFNPEWKDLFETL